MAHRGDGLNDIFEHNVIIRETCTAKDFVGNGSLLTGITGGGGIINEIDGGSANSVFDVSLTSIDGGGA